MSDPKIIYLGPACQKEGDGREWCEDDVWTQCECGCSSVRYVLESDAQSELAALREDLDECDGERHRLRDKLNSVEQRLAAAEQWNAAIVGKVVECKVCGSDDLFWFAQNTVPNGIQQNRLSTHDVKCVFVLGFNHCSETLKLVSADKIAEQMTAALKPNESGASE